MLLYRHRRMQGRRVRGDTAFVTGSASLPLPHPLAAPTTAPRNNLHSTSTVRCNGSFLVRFPHSPCCDTRRLVFGWLTKFGGKRHTGRGALFLLVLLLRRRRRRRRRRQRLPRRTLRPPRQHHHERERRPASLGCFEARHEVCHTCGRHVFYKGGVHKEATPSGPASETRTNRTKGGVNVPSSRTESGPNTLVFRKDGCVQGAGEEFSIETNLGS
mmetsp:Transcript_6234/g.11674  ORF Transcript_6234/g.11674 Transcript_6234/m.11674 type:complete len:215 (+) Transcript_6234:214-858(+)